VTNPIADAGRTTRRDVAVAIPCHNEVAAVARVVEEWRNALPDAEIVVFDNNSNDGTGNAARQLGVRVVEVPAQGKGYAVRAIFEILRERDAVILVDGDGTYPADHVGPLLEPVLAGRLDMTVGARRATEQPGSLTHVRALGNILIRGAFRVLIGPGTGDLLSGYRVFGPRFLQAFTPESTGFEIETELAGTATVLGLRVAEFPVPYHPRIAGTASKLRVIRDGLRILATILAQSLRHRPWRLVAVVAVLPAAVLALAACLLLSMRS
jgi:glycosyltransferase involved in cell wall biosynthesis